MKRTAALAVVVVAALLALPAAAVAGDTPTFHGSVEPLPRHIRANMVSWHRGCPVPRRALRLLRVSYHGLDGTTRQGRLIVARRWAWPLVGVMRKLYDADVRFARMQLADRFGADDQRMMRANDTSAFNCRFVSGTTRWSEHAYGRAIDINPVQNPWVNGTHVSPRAGRAYLDRSDVRPGMIVAGDVTVRAFRSIGWGWGGTWSGARDYMHFSATGR